MYERIWGEQKAEAPSKVSGGTSVISSSRKSFRVPGGSTVSPSGMLVVLAMETEMTIITSE